MESRQHERASGAALVSETWPAKHRGKALGVIQSSWAIGYAAAAVVTALVLPRFGWRAVFFVGVLPALFTLWVRRRVEEPELWRARRAAATVGTPAERAASSRRSLAIGGTGTGAPRGLPVRSPVSVATPSRTTPS